ncbi:MAG: ADP-ribosylglycohydrolase family protein [Candidatus Hydrogenedentales bacterium]
MSSRSFRQMGNDLIISRAQGCLLGQFSGDALGSLVEFQSPEEIRRSYPDGVRELAYGGICNTVAGQPTMIQLISTETKQTGGDHAKETRITSCCAQRRRRLGCQKRRHGS